VFWNNRPDVFAEARYGVAARSGRGRFRISLRPTADLDPTVALGPAGVWTVRLKNKSVPSGAVVQAWIERDESLYGFPERGRQSYFEDAAYVRHDHAGRDKETDDAASVVRRESTMNGMATGRNAIVAGGYIRKDMIAAPYSAAGHHVPPVGVAMSRWYGARDDSVRATEHVPRQPHGGNGTGSVETEAMLTDVSAEL
jgi:hypothetical protein